MTRVEGSPRLDAHRGADRSKLKLDLHARQLGKQRSGIATLPYYMGRSLHEIDSSRAARDDG